MKPEPQLHALLERQLRRIGLDPAAPPDADGWSRLLDAVSRAYVQHDQDHYLLERSLEISSTEMRELNDELRAASATALAVERDRLRAALEAADAANAAKSSFLALMSHEIRTPMNGVQGVLELLRGSMLDAEQSRLVDTAGRSCEALLTIINDILDLSKVEAGHLRLEAVDVDPRALVREAVELLEPQSERKGLRLTATVADDVPVALRGDPVRLRQVLLNLLANAVKFTHEGGVAVRVSCEEQDDAGARLRFTVRDTGIGLEPDVLARLFQPFVQADASTTRRYGGTGLGLTISKKLVELMGGEIGVDSTPGAGSVFWFTVQCGRAIASPVVRTPPDAPSALVAGLRVLLVEDNDVNREVALAMLAMLGCDTDTASNGREAVDAVAATHYEVVLMDCQMPVMDGYEATREIRRREGGARPLAIVALTANAVAGDREKCLAAGMSGYLAKPFTLDGLRQTLAAAALAPCRTGT